MVRRAHSCWHPCHVLGCAGGSVDRHSLIGHSSKSSDHTQKIHTCHFMSHICAYTRLISLIFKRHHKNQTSPDTHCTSLYNIYLEHLRNNHSIVHCNTLPPSHPRVASCHPQEAAWPGPRGNLSWGRLREDGASLAARGLGTGQFCTNRNMG